MTLIIIGAVVLVVLLYFVGVYNGLVRLRNNRENAFANIDVQLKQRYDMIPQLVSTVKGYAAHEKTLLEEVTRARTAAMSATSINDKIQAENALSAALAGLKVSVEAYPELKAMYSPDDGNTEVFFLKDAKATFSSFTAAPKTVEF